MPYLMQLTKEMRDWCLVHMRSDLLREWIHRLLCHWLAKNLLHN
jgi:hypothetical protein